MQARQPRREPAVEGPPAYLAWDGERVLRLRRHLGLSQAEMAGRLGTRQQTISEWETGASRPQRMSRRLLHLVAEASGFYDAGGADARAGGAP